MWSLLNSFCNCFLVSYFTKPCLQKKFYDVCSCLVITKLYGRRVAFKTLVQLYIIRNRDIIKPNTLDGTRDTMIIKYVTLPVSAHCSIFTKRYDMIVDSRWLIGCLFIIICVLIHVSNDHPISLRVLLPLGRSRRSGKCFH